MYAECRIFPIALNATTSLLRPNVKSLRASGGFTNQTTIFELCNFHEDNHERKKHQRLDKRQSENQRQLNERPRRRVPSHRFASRRAHLALPLRSQSRSDCNGEARSNSNPVSSRTRVPARLSESRDRQNRKHHHHKQHHQHLPHCFLLMNVPPVGG